MTGILSGIRLADHKGSTSLDHEILAEYQDFGAVVAVLGSEQDDHRT